MTQRCYYEKHAAYKDYGGRGIQICDEWLDDYKAFRSWALENGYRDGLTIDRIDHDGNYEPGNCRWVSRARQMRNIRTNTCNDEIAAEIRRRYGPKGVTMRGLAAEFGISLSVVHGCIHGTKWWPIDD